MARATDVDVESRLIDCRKVLALVAGNFEAAIDSDNGSDNGSDSDKRAHSSSRGFQEESILNFR